MKRGLWSAAVLSVVVAATLIAVVVSQQDRDESAANSADDISHTLINYEGSELDWCAEHSVPEWACTKCSPDLIDQFKATGDWCGGHDLPESHCRLCNPGIEFPQELMLRRRSIELTEDEIKVSLFFRPNTAVCATN